MAKIKVHELAKELGISNKEIIGHLNERGYDAVTAVSAIPESEVDGVRAKFGGVVKSAAPKKAEAEASRSAAGNTARESVKAAEAEEEDKPKKKSGIVRVYRSQNASKQLGSKRKSGQDQNAGRKQSRSEGRREAAPKTDAVVKPAEKPAEMPAEKPAVKPVEKPEVKAEETAVKTEAAPAKPEAVEKPAEKAPERAEKSVQKAETASDQAEKKEEKAAEAPKTRLGQVKRSYNLSDFENVGRSSSIRGNGGNRGGQGQKRFGGQRDGNRNGQGGQRQGGQNRDNARGGFNNRNQNGGNSQGRDGRSGGFGQRNFRDGNSNGNGGGFAGQRRPAPARGGAMPSAMAGDGALAHKTSRDFHKDGKDRQRNKDDNREKGFRGEGAGRQNSRRKQFNHIPKALQERTRQNKEPEVKETVTEITIPERITVRDLAEKMKIVPAVIIKELFMKGQMVTVNHELTFEQAEEIAMSHDIIAEKEEKEDVIGELLKEDEENEETMVQRPPVVCVMGHVDHGKTSLLDAIRNTHVTDREAGGITQHIGAYMVSIKGQKITFLDTPGHEAFTAMRMRGANSTDIAVLVVAADDGVMPQTVEAINHAKAAEVEIIVAINKIDKPGANIERVKQELSEYGLVSEDWGGDTIFCPVSAKTQEGLDNLLEMILLSSEMHELKANPNRKARGLVLEARLDRGKGPVASILVQKGTLKQGDFIACGAAYGKVRAMTDEKGKTLRKATPSMPVEIIGLSSVPEAGEVLVAMDSSDEAKKFAAVFVNENKKTLIEETKTQMSLDDLFNQIKEGNLKELPIVVKADVQGSVEAVSQSLQKLSNEEVVVKIIHGGVGTINESDVTLASASNAIIIGFNVKADATAKAIADTQKVDIHLYSVIYEAIEEVGRALKGMRAAVFEEKIQGHAEIRQMFKSSGVGNIAGAYIKDGTFTRSSKVRVFRGEEKIFEGELASLKRFKDDVKEVREGYECGLVFDGWGEFDVEDTVEAYTMVEVPRE